MRELALKSERVYIGLLILKPEDAARFPECFVECIQIPKTTSLARKTKKSVPSRMLVDLIAEAPQPRGQLGLQPASLKIPSSKGKFQFPKQGAGEPNAPNVRPEILKAASAWLERLRAGNRSTEHQKGPEGYL